ncbi:MAG: hypothetical protein Ct9H90mP15_04810 [Candidatus Neomarinimicrobiota bacterium]|nr:MAG: hypothetical protein Ct9H90mP15_04810 [Candidatus Neomarinimicrobiota bacterium]
MLQLILITKKLINYLKLRNILYLTILFVFSIIPFKLFANLVYEKNNNFLIFFAVLIAQHNHDHNHPEWIRCATDELEQELQLTNPEFIAERDIYVEKAQRLLRENPQWRTNQAR